MKTIQVITINKYLNKYSIKKYMQLKYKDECQYNKELIYLILLINYIFIYHLYIK